MLILEVKYVTYLHTYVKIFNNRHDILNIIFKIRILLDITDYSIRNSEPYKAMLKTEMPDIHYAKSSTYEPVAGLWGCGTMTSFLFFLWRNPG